MPTGGASQKAIEHHYDVGRGFYELWLDPSLTYSCALWPSAVDDDLDVAQHAKLAWHASGLLGGPVQVTRVLDVGCGWGSMLDHLAVEHGITDTVGLTLSADQATHITGRWPDRSVELRPWADHVPSTPYDAIVSIGAFEHFARPELDTAARRDVYGDFFERCWSWLVPGGRLTLQSIAMEDEVGGEGPIHEFMSREVFPESQLPRLSDIATAADPWFRILLVRSDAAHYEHTLELWQRRLEAHKDEATAEVGKDTYRHYLRYLRVCRAMFDRGTCTLYRLVMQRRDEPVALP